MNTKKKLGIGMCCYVMVWLTLTIAFGVDYAQNHENASVPPPGSIIRTPPTLTWKKLLITKNSLTYNGEKLKSTKLYFQ